jgi:hypothetical protein
MDVTEEELLSVQLYAVRHADAAYVAARPRGRPDRYCRRRRTIRSANARRGHPDDCIGLLFDFRLGAFLGAYVALAVDYRSTHAVLPVMTLRRTRTARRSPVPSSRPPLRPARLARLEQDDVTGADLLSRPVPLLNPSGAGRDDQYLSEQTGVPRGPCPGLEGHGTAARAGLSAAKSGSRRTVPVDQSTGHWRGYAFAKGWEPPFVIFIRTSPWVFTGFTNIGNDTALRCRMRRRLLIFGLRRSTFEKR